MKKIYIILFALIVFIGPLRSQTLSETIVFEERVHDFGTILEEKGKVSHTFVFRNNGNTPVVVNEIYSGCGCIGKVLSKDPVKPGEKGQVIITFSPDYKSGFFSKEIVVYSNNGQQYNRIWVEGIIKPAEHPVEDEYPYNFGNGLFLRLKVMAFGYLNPGETRQMELHYANNTNQEMTLDFVVEGNKDGLKFTKPGKIKPNATGIINFSYQMPYLSFKDVAFRLFPYVNNKKLKETLDITILNMVRKNQKELSKQKN